MHLKKNKGFLDKLIRITYKMKNEIKQTIF